MKEIPLTRGYVAIVDDEDYERLSRWKWSYVANGKGYACHYRFKAPVISMHRFILDAPPGLEVDHINGLTLDNRKDNLRLATIYQNRRNRGASSNNKSGYKGVSWNTNSNAWLAYIRVDGRNRYLGTFKDLHDAAIAYNLAAIQYHGEFAKLNDVS